MNKHQIRSAVRFVSKMHLLQLWLMFSLIEAKKPNIMIILADDVGTGDVPGYWQREKGGKVNMANLEALVGNGTTFTDAHSTPLCAPSRYVLLSGNYQHRGVRHLGVWSLNYKTNQFWDDQQSIANVLQDNGYYTGVFGKWHLGAKVPTKSGVNLTDASVDDNSLWGMKKTLIPLTNEIHDWSQPLEDGPNQLGFDTSYISMSGIQRPPFVFFRDEVIDLPNWNRTEPIKEHVFFWRKNNYETPTGITKITAQGGEGSKVWDSAAYNMIVVNETEKFIDQHLSINGQDKPFFAYVPLGAAHKPHCPPYNYLDGTPIDGTHETAHMDVLAELDKVVGSLIQMLDNRQVLEDTIVVFTSDNGGSDASELYNHFSSGPLRGHKGSVYEGGHRIPLTIRWDNGGIPKGESRTSLIGLNDMFATLCDLAGVEVPAKQALDSVSFANYARDNQNITGLRSSLGVWTYDKVLKKEAIRQGKWKLIHDYQSDKFELYNMKSDKRERRNVFNKNERLKKLGNKMFSNLKKISPCYDKLGYFPVGDMTQNCAWFMENQDRCYQHIEGIYNCRKTCASLADRSSC